MDRLVHSRFTIIPLQLQETAPLGAFPLRALIRELLRTSSSVSNILRTSNLISDLDWHRLSHRKMMDSQLRPEWSGNNCWCNYCDIRQVRLSIQPLRLPSAQLWGLTSFKISLLPCLYTLNHNWENSEIKRYFSWDYFDNLI